MNKFITCILLSIFSCNSTTAPLKIVNNKIYKTAIEYSKTKTWYYDATYYKIPYPNGDVPYGGACTDVVIRVLRANNIDLQELIHNDMTKHFDQYPKHWGMTKPDANIDHRRVYNIMTYLNRQGYSKVITNKSYDFKPGDIICWELYPGITHTGILLTNNAVYHNIGPQAKIDNDFLFKYKIIGHYQLLNK